MVTGREAARRSGAHSVVLGILAAAALACFILALRWYVQTSFRHHQWKALPAVAELDGREVFVGGFTAFGEKRPHFVAAYDTGSMERLWLFGGMANRPHRICVEGSSVFVVHSDVGSLALDLRGGQLREVEGPVVCPSRRRAEASSEQPVFDGFTPNERALTDGDLAVANGRSSETAVPIAIGYDPSTGNERWRVAVGTVDPDDVTPFSNEQCALARGRFVTHYRDASGLWHLVALDARSGERSWETELSDIFAVDKVAALRLTDRYLYVLRTQTVDVFDAATGELLGTVGDEKYE